MARFALSADFALAAAYFLLVTLASSLNIHVLNAAWLRAPRVQGRSHPLSAFTLLSAAGLALALTAVWLGYRHWAFGPGDATELAMSAAASLSYLYYLAQRRQWLLEGEFARAAWGDGLRAGALFAGAALAHAAGHGVDFPNFLALFAVAHAVAALPALTQRGARPQIRWWAGAVQPLAELRQGDWMGVGSGVANLVFSQAASLIAPLLIGAVAYANLRAYELFLFPTIFMAQVLDPIYMRRYREQHEGHIADRGGLTECLVPAAWLFLPLALVCLLAATLPLARTGLETLIAPAYRPEFWLLALVLALSSSIALNAPLRWRLTVTGQGGALLKGTAFGIVASLAVLALLTRWNPEAWTVLVARMVYEAGLLGAGLLAVRRPRKVSA
jgi:hypothetical protein